MDEVGAVFYLWRTFYILDVTHLDAFALRCEMDEIHRSRLADVNQTGIMKPLTT